MRNSLQRHYAARHASAESSGRIARCTASAFRAPLESGRRSANEAGIAPGVEHEAAALREPVAAAAASIGRWRSIQLLLAPKPAGDASAMLRQIRVGDAAAMQDFVRALSPASRRLRFHAALSELPEATLHALTRVDQRAHVAFVLTTRERGTERIVGEARYAISDQAETAEFAIAVADSFQGCGVADRLLAVLVDTARAAGLRWLVGDVLADNARMLGFVRRCGFTQTRRGVEPGLVRVERSVDRPLIPRQQGGFWTGAAGRRVRRGLTALLPATREDTPAFEPF